MTRAPQHTVYRARMRQLCSRGKATAHTRRRRYGILVISLAGAAFGMHRLIDHAAGHASTRHISSPAAVTRFDDARTRPARGLGYDATRIAMMDRQRAQIPAPIRSSPRDDIGSPTQTPTQHHYEVQSGDTLTRLFQRAGIQASMLRAVLANPRAKRFLTTLHPGDLLTLQMSDAGRLAGLRYRGGPLSELILTVNDGEITARVEKRPVTSVTRVVSHDVDVSLTAAMAAAGVEPNVRARFTHIFRRKLDFRHDLRAGAAFAVVYERRYAAGQQVGTGPVSAARLNNRGHEYTAFRYPDDHGESHYYTRDGAALERSIRRTPVNYTRVSSPFSERRWHPIQHLWRPHHGVDLAAPIGTPIKAAADGTVKYAARMSGYGRLVELEHDGPYATRYGHLHRFASGLHVGARVRQGDIIGTVGESGEATGPHLHYEIRVNGTPCDPLHVALPGAEPLPDNRLAAFKAAIAPLRLALAHPNEPPALAALAARGGIASSDDQTRLAAKDSLR